MKSWREFLLKKMQKFSTTFALLVISIILVAPLIKGDDDDDDDDKCRVLKSPRLFGTKTLYRDAREALGRIDDDDLPKPFDEDSLESEHNDLLKDHCSPVALYFMGRHSARFPDGEDIDKYNGDLLELIKRMNSAPAARGGCRKNRQDFLNWTPKMQTKHDNLITEMGANEERQIARRFKRLYPDFFDARKADIKIGVTEKVRTAQTGYEFLKEVDGLNLDSSCRNTPTNDPNQPQYDVDKVLGAACYKFLVDNYKQPFLDFHKQCERISGEEKIKDPLIDRVRDPKLKRRMARRVGKKLGLSNQENQNGGGGDADSAPAISVKMLDSIWNMCKFETAMQNSSIWCSLFEKKDVAMLEYIEDVNTYIKSAYGPKANPRQSCPVVGNLVESFQDVMQKSGAVSDQRKRAYFYFSHADPIKKLLAAFGMFKDDESFTSRRVAEFESELKVPKKRHWRSSLISPFSANLAFVLYRCPHESHNGNARDKYKVLASVTEQPVKLGGCKNTDCNMQRFLDAYENMRDCDLNKICRRAQ